MPINVSSSAGQTTISGSTTTHQSSGSVSGSGLPSYPGTGSYPNPLAGSQMIVSGSNCYDIYVNLPLSGATTWVYLTGSC